MTKKTSKQSPGVPPELFGMVQGMLGAMTAASAAHFNPEDYAAQLEIMTGTFRRQEAEAATPWERQAARSCIEAIQMLRAAFEHRDTLVPPTPPTH